MPISRITICTLAGVWLLMLVFTSLTPLAYDDYSYFLSSPNVADVIPSAWKLYQTWNGRFIANILANVLVLVPTPVYCLLTASAFVALLLCMLVIAYGKNWKKNVSPLAVVFAFALVWSSVPGFGAAFFWRVGTAYYLWTSLAIFACFVPFRLLYEKQDYAVLGTKPFIALCLVCFIAGLSIENMGLLPLFFSLFVLFIKRRQNIPFSRKYYSAAACILAGFLCLLLAPGNYMRLQADTQNLPLAVQSSLIGRFLYWVEKMLMGHGAMLTAIVILAALVYVCRRFCTPLSDSQKKFCLLAAVFFSFGCMSSGAMFFSPGYPLRAFTGIALLYIQAALCLFVAVRHCLPYKKLCALVMCVALSVSVVYEIYVFGVNHAINQERLRIFAVSRGQDVVVPAYPLTDKFFFLSSQIKDLQNPGIVNGLIARYYDLKSVKTP